MREEVIIQAVNDIDTIARLTEDLHQQHFINEPDYWEKLHHQVAIAMAQGLLGNNEQLNYLFSGVYPPDRPEYLAKKANDFATALVEKLKNEK